VIARALQNAIFNSANFSSIATDANGVIQIFNVGAERMLGFTAEEVTSKITPADISDPAELLARANALSCEFGTVIAPGFETLIFKATRGIEDIYELTYIRKDGSRLPAVVSVTALRDAEGVIIGYALIGTDNTARRQIEEERTKLKQRLRDQHFYTRSLIEANIDALMMTDPRGIIADVNKQAETLTGCTRDELIGSTFMNHFTDCQCAHEGIRRVLTEGKVTNYELTARARDGTLTVVSCNATTFHDRDRKLQGVVATARDVTERNGFEHALQRTFDELEQANRMKSEFLATMSHELRTPLNSIIGFSEVLKDGLVGALNPKQIGIVGGIFSNGKHLLSLIDGILDLSSVEAGAMALDLGPVDVSTLLAESVASVRDTAALRRTALTLEVDVDVGVAWVDAGKVQQIMACLLSNALKFTLEGGCVTVGAKGVSFPRQSGPTGAWAGRMVDRRGERPCDAFVEIVVADNGIGISRDELTRLFQPFSQLDRGFGRKFEGMGLGLAMVRLLTELHGGTVAVDSALGEGSRFTVWLPLRTAP
jgi:PAS domain S-box-containing protein